MGMTIEDCINYFESTIDELAKEGQYCEVFEMVVDTMRKYQKFQDQALSLYMERLNADMVAMLTELKNKLIDKSWNIDMYDDDLDFECCYLNDIDEVIQQKINALQGEEE